MALIKCINCGKEISDKSDKCIHCNTKIIKEVKSTKDNNNSFWFNLLNNYLINTILTTIFILMLYYMATIEYRYSYTFMEFIEYRLFPGDGFTFIQIFIWVILLICLLFTGLNKVTNILAKIAYVGMIIGEILFVILLENATSYSALENYYILIGYSIIWVIYLFITNGKFKKTTFKKKNNNTLDELNKAKELLDKKIITEEEFNKIKNKVLKDYID